MYRTVRPRQSSVKHPRKQRKDGCLGFATGGRRHRNGVITTRIGMMDVGLERPQ